MESLNNNKLFYAAINGTKNKYFESEPNKYRTADDFTKSEDGEFTHSKLGYRVPWKAI